MRDFHLDELYAVDLEREIGPRSECPAGFAEEDAGEGLALLRVCPRIDQKAELAVFLEHRAFEMNHQHDRQITIEPY